jgi:hypothetical protein
MSKLISLKQAEALGIERVRKTIWANQLDHLHIGHGVWMHLYCPFNQECNGRDPVDMLKFQVDAKEWETKEWEPYAGPLPDSEEYKTEVARFDGCLKDSAPIQNRSQKG